MREVVKFEAKGDKNKKKRNKGSWGSLTAFLYRDPIWQVWHFLYYLNLI